MTTETAPGLNVSILSDRELLMTRQLDAPRELVWEAMTTPEHVKHWWGPSGYTMSSCEIDLRPGGSWRFVQLSPDGREFPFKGVYREITRPERVVQTFIFDVEPFNVHESVETMTLTERDGGTLVSVHVLYESIEVRDGVIASGMEKGAAETYDRLAEYLTTIG